MTDRWRVREANLADVPSIVEVQDATWLTDFAQWVHREQLLRDPTWSARLWRDRMARTATGDAILVADDGSRIHGFVWTRHWDDTRDLPAQTLKLNALYVHPALQSEGVGSALMREALWLASEVGYRHAALWVIADNVRARRFYERHGWRADATTTKLWRGATELRYQRALDPHAAADRSRRT